jgi:glycosyltransferase involved in cell wall biosynthesis
VNTSGHRPLRLAILSDHFHPTITGQGIHTCQLALAMVRRGHHVVVITTRCSGQPPFEEWNGIRVYRTRTVPVHEFHNAIPSRKDLESILKKENITIVHYQSLGVLIVQGWRAARALGIKQIYSHHVLLEFLLGQIVFLRPFHRWIGNVALRFFNQCNALTYPARRLQAEAREKGIRAPTFYISSSTGIENGRTQPVQKEPGATFNVLSVGRLHPDKNVSCLVKAFARFRAQVNTGQLWIVGRGGLKDALIQEVESLGITPHVTFTGWQSHDDVGRYYAQADVFAMPSLFDSQGNAAIEAMFYSLPLVLSRNLIAAPDLVEDGENGYLVDPRSPDDVAEKLLKLYADRARAKAMGTRSRERFEQFRDEAIFSETEQLYFKILGEKTVPPAR